MPAIQRVAIPAPFVETEMEGEAEGHRGSPSKSSGYPIHSFHHVAVRNTMISELLRLEAEAQMEAAKRKLS